MNEDVVSIIKKYAHRLTGSPEDYDSIVAMVGDAQFVFIGEASHGTHEFYHMRCELSKRLIQEKGFTIVAVEADWPDAYRVNRYVRGDSHDTTPREALGGFERFPLWMWRNEDVQEFAAWLRWHNNEDMAPGHTKAGFYGLDLYSLNSSREAVVRYLDKVDPGAARRARYRYSCFDHYGEDSQAYGFAASMNLSASCEREVIQQLMELRERSAEYANRDGHVAEDEFFYAEQNARLVANAEHYYRTMFEGRISSWNLRDQHMADSLDSLVSYLGRRGAPAKAIVWAHNSHLGDARATQMSLQNELNLGQLARKRYPGQTALIGFTTYSGTVTAASDWGGAAETKRVRPALAGSFEELFHLTVPPGFLLIMKDNEDAGRELRKTLLERAIGVIYRPETERVSHYFEAQLADQFDAVIHIDETTAVVPLDRRPEPAVPEEVPETYPSGV